MKLGQLFLDGRALFRDEKYQVEYSASVKGKRVSFSMAVEAPDTYTAGDKVKAEAEKRFGPDHTGIVMKFGASAKRLPSNSISNRTARNVGPEEE